MGMAKRAVSQRDWWWWDNPEIPVTKISLLKEKKKKN